MVIYYICDYTMKYWYVSCLLNSLYFYLSECCFLSDLFDSGPVVQVADGLGYLSCN